MYPKGILQFDSDTLRRQLPFKRLKIEPVGRRQDEVLRIKRFDHLIDRIEQNAESTEFLEQIAKVIVLERQHRLFVIDSVQNTAARRQHVFFGRINKQRIIQFFDTGREFFARKEFHRIRDIDPCRPNLRQLIADVTEVSIERKFIKVFLPVAAAKRITVSIPLLPAGIPIVPIRIFFLSVRLQPATADPI